MLIVTDRMENGARLKRAVAAVGAFEVATLDETVTPRPDLALIICDVGLADACSIEMTKAFLARHRPAASVPIIHLDRDPSRSGRADRIGATVSLPASVSDHQLQFTIRRLLDRRTVLAQGNSARDVRVERDVRAAGESLAGMFAAAARGDRIGLEQLDHGGAAVVDALAKGGLDKWLRVVRTFDDATYQHCLLVAGLATAFAVELGVSPSGQRVISQASLIHDVGKASVPRAILNKPGQLSSAEAAVMRNHARSGYDLLSRQGGVDPRLLDVVRHHHELLDGSGYPDGLRGDGITPTVRLITICDIYAALIERRPYKAPMPPAAAYGVLTDMGRKLDGGLVAAFERIASTDAASAGHRVGSVAQGR